jgi:hypothetical protein
MQKVINKNLNNNLLGALLLSLLLLNENPGDFDK